MQSTTTDPSGISILENPLDFNLTQDADVTLASEIKLYYIDGNNKIIETDENGSFTNILYQTSNGQYLRHLFVNQNTQYIYWIEGANSNSAMIKRSLLNSFNPELVLYISDQYTEVKQLWVSDENLVFWSTNDIPNPFILGLILNKNLFILTPFIFILQ